MSIKMNGFVKAGIEASELGVSKGYLRKVAMEDGFPDGAVIATGGRHFLYDVEKIKESMVRSYENITEKENEA